MVQQNLTVVEVDTTTTKAQKFSNLQIAGIVAGSLVAGAALAYTLYHFRNHIAHLATTACSQMVSLAAANPAIFAGVTFGAAALLGAAALAVGIYYAAKFAQSHQAKGEEVTEVVTETVAVSQEEERAEEKAPLLAPVVDSSAVANATLGRVAAIPTYDVARA
jgi:hypothetical protein